MAKTTSTMLALGTTAPEFMLTNVITNQPYSLQRDPQAAATLIMFICNHCPYVKHINHGLSLFAQAYLPKQVRIIAINANDAEQYPEDDPEHMQQTAQQEHFIFPYLWDPTQEVAKAYHAACTPDFFLFNNQLELVYRGQFDDARPGNAIPVTGFHLRTAIDQLLSQQPITVEQKPSLGCNIKWKNS